MRNQSKYDFESTRREWSSSGFIKYKRDSSDILTIWYDGKPYLMYYSIWKAQKEWEERQYNTRKTI